MTTNLYDAHQSNMQYLRLRPREYDMWELLMGHSPCCTEGDYKMTMDEWPESLKEYVRHVVGELGACGDVIACAVADWVARREMNETIHDKKEPNRG